MSVFILWLVTFDVNLLRHRHFRFIIVGVDLTSIQGYLEEISAKEGCFHLLHRKYQFKRMHKLANEMNLEDSTENNFDFDTYNNFYLSRRTIYNSNTTNE